MEKNALSGKIIRGIGEAAMFLSMPHYKREIKEKLGFDAYPGTLNIETEENKEGALKNIKPVRIDGYRSQGKVFGGASCYKAKIKDIGGAVIIPDVNKHPENIIEFIAPVHIKSKLRLKIGDEAKIRF